MGWPRFIFLGTVIGLARTFASMHFSSVSLLLNESVSSDHRGTMNGLSTLGGSVAKTIGPMFAGTVFAACVNSNLWSERFGAFTAFGILTALSALVALVALRAKGEIQKPSYTQFSEGTVEEK